MKRALLLITIVAGVIIVFVGISWIMIQSTEPGALINRLQSCDPQERKDILLFLNAGSSDAVPALLAAIGDRENFSELRADLVEVLYQIYSRVADPRIEEAMGEFLKDPDVVFRRRAINCHSLYTPRSKHELALPCLDDKDPEVRAKVYMMFNTWGDINEELRETLLPYALQDWQHADNADLKYFAHLLVGREVTFRCEEATQLLQRNADVVGAEKMLRSALELDPENHRAKIRLVRHFLNIQQREKAIELAEEYGALLRIPLLPAAPVLDGDPTDEVWQKACKTEHPYLTTNRFITERAVAKTTTYLGHRDGVIYIASIAYEDNLDGLVVKKTIRDQPVFEDDCMEYFFDPDNSESTDYKFAINAGGAVFDRLGNDSSIDFPCEQAVKIFKDRGYWACEFSVPVAALVDKRKKETRKLTSESVWGISLLRARIQAPSEQCATWPTFGALQLHLFPIAIFEGAPPPETVVAAPAAEDTANAQEAKKE
ncbi:MAG: hypothetical protein JXA52_09915 [Planctomycetes bacterium]|nr:hypothetical protein [Planctomycetota bacterium]